MQYLRTPLAVMLLLLGGPALLEAQIQLSGRVVEAETVVPIGSARIMLFDAAGRRVALRESDADGWFSFTVRRDGPYRIRASRMGYQTATTPQLWLGEHGVVEVEVRLAADAVLLAPLEVTVLAARRSPLLEDFRARLNSGLGIFITREEIEQRRPSQVTDLLATVAGVHLVRAGNRPSGREVYMARAMSGPRDCPAQVFIDGFLLNRRDLRGVDPGFTIDDAVHPSSVEGIEIYHGISGVPAQFLNPDAKCGVVAIWTRRGG